MREIKLVWDRDAGKHSLTGQGPPKEPFVCGPIPLRWLEAAARLPGKALHVGVAAWFVAGLNRRRDSLPLSTERLARLGVTRQSKQRALQALEAAGLVTIERHANRAPRVTLKVNANGCQRDP